MIFIEIKIEVLYIDWFVGSKFRIKTNKHALITIMLSFLMKLLFYNWPCFDS